MGAQLCGPLSISVSTDDFVDDREDGKVFKVLVPPGAEPGSVINVKAPDGTWVQAVVPPGSGPAREMVVPMPAPSAKKQISSQFKTLHDAFEYCDPNGTGFVTDHARFAYVARVLANDVGDQETVWSHLDQDGNGAVNWPEFVEWAENNHVPLDPGGADGDSGQISFPSSWKGPKDNPDWVSQYGIVDASHFSELNQLVQMTYKNVWTRDRKATGVNKVPIGYELISAKRCENFRDWRRYYLKRHQLAHACSTRPGFVERRALSSNAAALCKR
eukprot:TRINITY_DN7152_c0_g1_i1.p1 TRINITY_DN7152_c0_g1~~TRINITY_DN7152_c0_g1_i1.p1  ORF type:complete len:273 (-),score=32.51 TRINITY_DN7152_c0_g1_i1:748-1566(-)